MVNSPSCLVHQVYFCSGKCVGFVIKVDLKEGATDVTKWSQYTTRKHSRGCVLPASIATTRCQYQGGVYPLGWVVYLQHNPLCYTHSLYIHPPWYTPSPLVHPLVYPALLVTPSGIPLLRRDMGPGISTSSPWTEWQTLVKTLPSRNFVGGR